MKKNYIFVCSIAREFKIPDAESMLRNVSSIVLLIFEYKMKFC